MPGRKFNNGNQYRYGFNGKEQDKETTGTTTYDYGFRIYNPGLSRFLSVDPLAAKHPNESTYLSVGGNPIMFNDPDGKDRIISTTTIYDFGNGNVLSFVSKRIINEDFIISKTSAQNSAIHYLYMDTYEQHVDYYNVITGEEKNSSSVSYPVRFKSAYDTRKWTGRIGRKWEKSVDWFSNLMKDGYEGYHEGGGIMLTSKIGEGTDRGAKRPFMDASPVDIDNLVATISQLKATAGYERANDILNILERFVDKIETANSINDQVEELRRNLVGEPSTTTPTSTPGSPANTTTIGKGLKPDSIFIRVPWEHSSSDGEVIESGDSSKKVKNPDTPR